MIDLTAQGTDDVALFAPLRVAAGGGLGARRSSRSEGAPVFTLEWLDVPADVGTAALPLGTCLVLCCVDGQTPFDLVVELAGGKVRRAEVLARDLMLGLVTPTELASLVELGTVFVEWATVDGARFTAWLRVPAVPSRYCVRGTA